MPEDEIPEQPQPEEEPEPSPSDKPVKKKDPPIGPPGGPH